MLTKFTIDHTDEKKSEYEYFNVFGPESSKKKTGVEWTYTIVDTEGNEYRLFHQRKPAVGLRPGKKLYVSLKAPSDSSWKDIYRFYTAKEFLAEVRKTIENRQKRIDADTAEIIRLGDMCELG